jgi:hypothetical protein
VAIPCAVLSSPLTRQSPSGQRGSGQGCARRRGRRSPGR